MDKSAYRKHDTALTSLAGVSSPSLSALSHVSRPCLSFLPFLGTVLVNLEIACANKRKEPKLMNRKTNIYFICHNNKNGKLKKRQPLTVFIIGTFFILVILQFMPTNKGSVKDFRIYTDGDQLYGSVGPTYFALTARGTLIGWGSNRIGQLGDPYKSIYRPFAARKVIKPGVIAFSCGTYTTAYVDQEHVLWEWGGEVSANQPQKILENVLDVAVGYHHVIALKEDGSIWTWGQNIHGELGRGFKDEKDGMILNNGQHYNPRKIMDHIRKIAVIDGLSCAITEDDSLYIWGIKGICSPTKVAENVQSISFLALGKVLKFQVLKKDGNVFLLDFSSKYSFSETAERVVLIAQNVQTLCEGGVIKQDDSLWRWEADENGQELIKVRNRVAYAVNSSFYVTKTGYLFSTSWLSFLPFFPHSIRTVSPLLRNIILVLFVNGALLFRLFWSAKTEKNYTQFSTTS